MPDAAPDPLTAGLAAIAADLRVTAELQRVAGYEEPTAALRHARVLLAALEVALNVAGTWGPFDGGTFAMATEIRSATADELLSKEASPVTWIVEVTRRVRLAVPASSDEEAAEAALDLAWEWCPEQAEGGDQGSAYARVVRAGDLPGAAATDLAVAGQLTLGGALGDDGTCPSCGSPDPAERAYVPGATALPVDCGSVWHDEDARGPGRA